MSKTAPQTGTGLAVLSVLAMIASLFTALVLWDVRIAIFGVTLALVLLTLTRILDRLDEIAFHLEKK